MTWRLEKVDQGNDWVALGLTEAVLLRVHLSPLDTQGGTLSFLWELPLLLSQR